MVAFFDNVYRSIGGGNKLLEKFRIYSLFRFITRVAANALIPLYFLATKSARRFSLVPNNAPEGRLVVSLTSFPTRIGKAWLAIETILRQSVKPDKIILWLSAEQFSGKDSLPRRLLEQQQRGLQIELRTGDLRSHKKYYYTRRELPEDIMITIDDDIFYPPDTIAELLKWHRVFPEAVIARYGLKIRRNATEVAPYKNWQGYYEQLAPRTDIFFGSGGGTLFPKHSLPPQTLEKDLFLKLAPHADDVWLNTMCRINGRAVFKTQARLCSILPVMINKDVFLSSGNLHESQNDVQLQNSREFFKEQTGVDPYAPVPEPA